MAVLKPFCALRPRTEYAGEAAALPYDVMDEKQAREMVKGKPRSFLHVDRAEIDFPAGVDPYGEQVYQKAAENLRRLEEEGVYRQDTAPAYYIYQEEGKGTIQRGIVCCASVREYEAGRIKRHELTRREKEEDRIRHVRTLRAHTGPIFLACPYPLEVTALLDDWTAKHPPVYDFVSPEGVGQKAWVLSEAETVKQLEDLLLEIPALYIADGHHRAASAVRVGQELRAQRGGEEKEASYEEFLAVVFPCEQLNILGYHRIVRDLGGHTPKGLLKLLGLKFEILLMPGRPCRPMEPHCFGLYLDGEWYHLRAREEVYQNAGLVESLDVSILQEQVLSPLLGIADPRSDKRIAFVGGGESLKNLAARAEESGGAVFVLYPTSMEELMKVADAGEIMPPKSTWFEPKIYSGLFIHKIQE